MPMPPTFAFAPASPALAVTPLRLGSYPTSTPGSYPTRPAPCTHLLCPGFAAGLAPGSGMTPTPVSPGSCTGSGVPA